jgi:hypothetical protein
MPTSSDVPHAATGIHHQPHGWSATAVTTAVARDQFELVYPMIRDFLLLQFEAHSMPQDAVEYFMRVNTLSRFLGVVTYLEHQVS